MDQQGFQLVGWMAGTVDEEEQTVPRAELLAVIRLAEATEGDLVVWCGNWATVQGVCKGPKALHEANTDLWERFWGARLARQGLFAVKKIKAHLDTLPHLLGSYPAIAVFVNMVADRLAGFAAAQVQVEKGVVDELVKLKGEVVEVQKWQLACIMEVWKARCFEGSTGTQRGVQHKIRQTWLQRLREAKATTSHTMSWHPRGGLLCTTCFRRGKSKGLFRWLGLHCSPKGLVLGPGHALKMSKGAIWCRKCGGWATRARFGAGILKLGRARLGCPTEHGKRAIAALLRGKAPQGVVDWPV
jgi:hypothetical protein